MIFVFNVVRCNVRPLVMPTSHDKNVAQCPTTDDARLDVAHTITICCAFFFKKRKYWKAYVCIFYDREVLLMRSVKDFENEGLIAAEAGIISSSR